MGSSNRNGGKQGRDGDPKNTRDAAELAAKFDAHSNLPLSAYYPASCAPMSKAPPSGIELPKKSRVPTEQPVRPVHAFVPRLIAGDPDWSVHCVVGLPIPW